MGFLDKAKEKASQLAEQAKDKIGDVKEKRKVDDLLDDLGRIVYRQRTERGEPGDEAEIVRLVGELRTLEAEGTDVLAAAPDDEQQPTPASHRRRRQRTAGHSATATAGTVGRSAPPVRLDGRFPGPERRRAGARKHVQADVVSAADCSPSVVIDCGRDVERFRRRCRLVGDGVGHAAEDEPVERQHRVPVEAAEQTLGSEERHLVQPHDASGFVGRVRCATSATPCRAPSSRPGAPTGGRAPTSTTRQKSSASPGAGRRDGAGRVGVPGPPMQLVGEPSQRPRPVRRRSSRARRRCGRTPDRAASGVASLVDRLVVLEDRPAGPVGIARDGVGGMRIRRRSSGCRSPRRGCVGARARATRGNASGRCGTRSVDVVVRSSPPHGAASR